MLFVPYIQLPAARDSILLIPHLLLRLAQLLAESNSECLPTKGMQHP